MSTTNGSFPKIRGVYSGRSPWSKVVLLFRTFGIVGSQGFVSCLHCDVLRTGLEFRVDGLGVSGYDTPMMDNHIGKEYAT